jgi:hypothetical protein
MSVTKGLVNVPVCAVGLYLAWRFLPADAPASPGTRSRLDLPGLLLIAPGLAGILFGLSNVGKSGGLGRVDVQVPLIAGLVLLIAFVAWTLRRAGSALIDVRLLRIRSVGASSAVLFLAGACTYAAMFLLASGHSAAHAFSQAFWWTIGFTLVAALASFLLPGRRPVP